MKKDTLFEAQISAINKAGGAYVLADKLGIRAAAIYQWRKIPINRVNKIAKLTGIPREALRPDIFGKG